MTVVHGRLPPAGRFFKQRSPRVGCLSKRDEHDVASALIEKAAGDEVGLRVLAENYEVPDHVVGFLAQQAVEKSPNATSAARGRLAALWGGRYLTPPRLLQVGGQRCSGGVGEHRQAGAPADDRGSLGILGVR